MPKFTIRRSYDAYQHYVATVEAKDGAEAYAIAQGSSVKDLSVEWKDDGVLEFDDLSMFTITNEAGEEFEFIGPDFKAEGFTE